MREDIKARWTARLRSGQDAQGTGYLKQEVASGRYDYCCLGVLCEIAVEDGIVRPSELRGMSGSIHTFTAVDDLTDNSDTILPLAVARWADISADGYQQPHDPEAVCPDRNGEEICVNELCGICRTLALTELNDGDNGSMPALPFPEIADVIEKWF